MGSQNPTARCTLPRAAAIRSFSDRDEDVLRRLRLPGAQHILDAMEPKPMIGVAEGLNSYRSVT